MSFGCSLAAPRQASRTSAVCCLTVNNLLCGAAGSSGAGAPANRRPGGGVPCLSRSLTTPAAQLPFVQRFPKSQGHEAPGIVNHQVLVGINHCYFVVLLLLPFHT